MRQAFLIALALVLLSQVCLASPLDNFSRGSMAIDVSLKPYAFEGSNAWDIGMTAGLDKKWAVAGRQARYDSGYAGVNYRTANQELNLIYKVNDQLQLYTGYSHTTGIRQATGLNVADKDVFQAGVIAIKKLDKRTTLYTILGGGKNVANVEVGLSYQLAPCLELTSTYRHLTVEKVGPAAIKENFRGFGLGLTYKI